MHSVLTLVSQSSDLDMIVTALTSISKTTCQLVTRHGGVIVKDISTIPPDIVAEDGHVQNQ